MYVSNAIYRIHIVNFRYYTPGYSDALLEQVEQFVPKISEYRFDKVNPEDVDLIAELNVPPRSEWESCV